MKEQIKDHLMVVDKYASTLDSDIERHADEIMKLVNAEVERRIKERIASITDEEIEKQFTTPHYHYEKGHYYQVRKDRIFGAKWFRSRMEGREK